MKQQLDELETFLAAMKLIPDASMEFPYDGVKEMIMVDDVDNREFLCELVESMWEELPKKNNMMTSGRAGGSGTSGR